MRTPLSSEVEAGVLQGAAGRDVQLLDADEDDGESGDEVEAQLHHAFVAAGEVGGPCKGRNVCHPRRECM